MNIVSPVAELMTNFCTSRYCPGAADPSYQSPVYLKDESLGYRPAAVQICADVLEGVTVVEKLSGIFRVRLRYGAASKKILCVVNSKSRSFDVRCVVRFEMECA